MKIFRFLLVSVLSLLTLSASASSYYKTVPYRVLKGGEGFTTDHYVNPFAGSTRSVLNLAVEIEGMQGFRLAVDEQGAMQPATIELQLQRSGNLLVAATSVEAAEAVAWGNANQLLAGTATPFAPGNLSPRADIVTYLYRNLAR